MIESKFILNILELLLDGEEEVLQQQMEFVSDVGFKYTGAGVFVEFELLNGVEIKSSALKIGADCTLFFKNGLIDYLEIWSYDGIYPKKELAEYELTQIWENSPQKRIKKSKEDTF